MISFFNALIPEHVLTIVLHAQQRSSEHVFTIAFLQRASRNNNLIWPKKRGTWLCFSSTTTVPAPAASSPMGERHRLVSPLRTPRTWGPPRTEASGKPNRDSCLLADRFRCGYGQVLQLTAKSFFEKNGLPLDISRDVYACGCVWVCRGCHVLRDIIAVAYVALPLCT